MQQLKELKFLLLLKETIISQINDEDNCYYDEKTDCCNDSCMMEKLKNLDCKVIVGAGIGALISCIGLCLLLKKK